MKIAVDFDGTLVNPIHFPQTNYTLLEGAKEVITELSNKGIEFELYTARYGWWRIPAILFIKKQKLPIKTKLFNKKPKANLYIDNNNIFCKEINWYKIKDEILKERRKLDGKS